ncbi:ribose transport system ATP-binding protein [Actinocorallia herbida]|uniref:Ribose transport system ATP-binding protein n=1 Tax=Actinocorallia herbida TaxID=58109 RepID=A0A3N1D0J6_9ACTN|nr:sugar ABC transporter ATP-binding protein [Actinocorallia herbida]ROO87063.1 ribose transport system ATP-binding protein [Actinocorallia herbida]
MSGHDQAEFALIADDLSKTYAGQKALDGVGLRVRRGTVHALIGGNGSGKSTTVKILAGVLHADPGGSVVIDGRRQDAHRLGPADAKAMGLHIVHQDIGIFPDLSIAENLAIGRGFELAPGGRIRWRRLRERARRVLDRFDLDVDPALPIGDLRPAEQMVVAIARALQDQEGAHSGVLILDEPTAALSASEVDLLLKSLRRYAERGQSILFISHRLDEICAVSDEVTVLRDGRRVATVENDGLAPADLARLIMGAEVPEAAPRLRSASGRARLEVRGLSTGGLRDVSFDVAAGEIVGIAGLLGSGRSRVLRALFGLERGSGTITLDGEPGRFAGPAEALGRGVGYVPENRVEDALFAEQSVSHNLSVTDVGRYWGRGRLRHRAERADAVASIAEFGVVAPGPDAPVTALSGGNQQKVVIARSLRRAPRLLLLDEPSQGVDVGARLDLHRIIRDAAEGGTSALVVSSDFTELADLCDRVLVLVDGRIETVLQGPGIDPSALAHLVYGPAGVSA